MRPTGFKRDLRQFVFSLTWSYLTSCFRAWTAVMLQDRYVLTRCLVHTKILAITALRDERSIKEIFAAAWMITCLSRLPCKCCEKKSEK